MRGPENPSSAEVGKGVQNAELEPALQNFLILEVALVSWAEKGEKDDFLPAVAGKEVLYQEAY